MSLDCWSNTWNHVGKPVSEIGHADFSPSYEVDTLHVFTLDNGKCVVVHECGCSCYESSQADLEVLPFARAMEKYISYKRENNGTFTNLELLEVKLIEKEEQEKANESRCKNCNP